MSLLYILQNIFLKEEEQDMTKKKSTKRALISSLLILAMCFTILAGTTFAWFTDSVASSGNIIKAGKLDVSMKYADGTKAVPTAESSDWKDASTGAIFKYDLWEPGYVDVKHIAISNDGTLALKYKVQIVANGEVSELADVIDVYYYDPAAQIAARTAIDENKKIGTLRAALSGMDTTASGNLLAGEKDVITIALKMQESAGNDYQMKSIGTDFSIVLLATQYTYEKDSFNDQYDAAADYALADFYRAQNMTVTDISGNAASPLTLTVDYNSDTPEEIAAAKKDAADALEGLLGASTDTEMAILAEGSTLVWETDGGHGSSPLVPDGSTLKELVIDGGAQGGDIVVTGAGVGPMRAANDGTIIFRNMTIKDESVSYAEGSWEFGYLEFAGKIVFENCAFKSSITFEGEKAEFINCTFETEKEVSASVPRPSDMYCVWISDGDVTFTGCEFKGPYRGLKMHEAYGSEISKVTVDNCTFGPLEKKPGIAIGTLNADTTVSITNCTFNKCQAGDQGLYSYETDTDVSSINFTYKGNTVNNI